ncbi:MAG: peptidylprolyl isomerase [Candidatus Zixiibacteriota bacterium]
MAQAKTGDHVKVHYTGKLDDGTVFDSSQDREPLEFVIGEGRLIPGFEQGVIGMQTGDKKTVSIPPDEGYGTRRDDLVISVPKSSFPSNITPTVGQRLEMTQRDGNPVKVTVSAIEEESVTLDANHPLAGRTLEFDIELVAVS